MEFENLILSIQNLRKENNIDIIIENLKIIVNLCSESEYAKDAFREVGGLDFLMEFIIYTDQVAILEYSLKVLAFAIDGNIHSQLYLTEYKVYNVLQTIFETKACLNSVLENALVLFSTILFQNRTAQDLMQENSCLYLLMNLYQHFALPLNPFDNNQIEALYSLEIWLRINSILCFAVNNPQNEKNQVMCSEIFPISLNIIETSGNPLVIDTSLCFLSLSISNNKKNQDTFAELGGFSVIKSCLDKNFEHIKQHVNKFIRSINKELLQNVHNLIIIIIAVVFNHKSNAYLCGKFGIVHLMIDLLSLDVLTTYIKKKLFLALGHCIDACSDNRFIILDQPKFDDDVKKSLEDGDQELYIVAQYILQVSLNGNDDLKTDCCEIEADNERFSSKSFYKRFQDDLHENQDKQNVFTQLNRNKNLFVDAQNDSSLLQISDTMKFSWNKLDDPNSIEIDKGSKNNSPNRSSLKSEGHLYQYNKTKMKHTLSRDTSDKHNYSNHGYDAFPLMSKVPSLNNFTSTHSYKMVSDTSMSVHCLNGKMPFNSIKSYSIQSLFYQHSFQTNTNYLENYLKGAANIFYEKTAHDIARNINILDIMNNNSKIIATCSVLNEKKKKNRDKSSQERKLENISYTNFETSIKYYPQTKRKYICKHLVPASGNFTNSSSRMQGCLSVIVLPGQGCSKYVL